MTGYKLHPVKHIRKGEDVRASASMLWMSRVAETRMVFTVVGKMLNLFGLLFEHVAKRRRVSDSIKIEFSKVWEIGEKFSIETSTFKECRLISDEQS